MAKPQKKIFFGIRGKLYVLTLVSFVLIIGVTLWRVGVGASQTAQEAVGRSLMQSSVILETKMDSRFSSIQETTYSLARDGRVLPFVFDGDSATLQDLTQEFQRALEFDMMMITSAQGDILARSDRPEAIGLNLAGRSELFDAALGGQAAHGIFASQGKLMQIVAVPVFDNVAKDLVRGTVALAYSLSSEIAREINKLTASDIAFYSFDRDEKQQISGVTQTYSTATLQLNKSLQQYFSGIHVDWDAVSREQPYMNIAIEDDNYYALVMPLEKYGGGALGFVLALRSQSDLLKPFAEIQRQVALVGLLGLIVAGILAGVIAHNLSRPIFNLVSVTEDIEQGQLPDGKKYARSNDETGLLYDALFRMGKSIKEKSDLEYYLAQLAQDIDDFAENADGQKLSQSDFLNIEDDTLRAAPQLPQRDQTQLFNDTGLPRTRSAHLSASFSSQDTLISDDISTIISDSKKAAEQGVATELLNVGMVIDDRYQIINLLGIGAVGQVYLAKDLKLNENLAFKILNQQKADDTFTQLYKEEIRLARRITHRNILRTFDFGIWQGVYYITMEYVQGHELATIIQRKGPLDIHIGVVMAKQICSALIAAHEQGIIHRDLKPANMMVNKQGILKIMDFGLAMQIDRDASGENKHKTTLIAGTPNYMAPEQFLAGELDERTDIYAVGAIFYTLFTGFPPFDSDSYEKLTERHLHSAPPKLTHAVPEAPILLETIIVKAMAKNKNDRYSSVRDMLADLQNV